MGFDPLDILNVILVAVAAGGLEQPPVRPFEVELAALLLSPVSDHVGTVAENPARAHC